MKDRKTPLPQTRETGSAWRLLLLATPLLACSGCHSAFVNATIINHTGAPLRLVEIDYPSASFGTSDLANGSTFKYRFKVLGTGPAVLLWTDTDKKDHTSNGPMLEEGQEGKLSVTLSSGTAQWSSSLHH